jgi:uncharacterized RDD family membrane protein YckC
MSVKRRAKGPSRVGAIVGAAGRVVLRPGRALVGSKGLDVPRRLETLAVDAAATPTAARTVDGVLAGPLPEVIGRALSDHKVIERIVDEMLARVDVDETVRTALESEQAERLKVELTDRVLNSPELEEIVARVLASPQVRHALTQTSTTFAEETIDGVRRRAVVADEAIDRVPRRWLRRSAVSSGAYAGIASRSAAFAIDLGLVALAFLTAAAFAALISSLVGHLRPVWLVDLVAGVAWFVVTAAYFVGFWSAAGQTPGMRLLGVRVLDRDGVPPGLVRSLVRLVGLVLAIIPCFAGFLPTLVDERRRALQDFLAGTVVLYAEPTAVGLGATRRRRAERRGPPTVAAHER